MPGVVASAVGYDLTALTPGVHRGLPSPYLTFIYSLSGPIVSGESLAQLGSRLAYRTEVLLGGLHQRPAYVEQPVQQAGLQLAVHPLAARALFGVPACELTQLAGDATDVLGSSACPAAAAAGRDAVLGRAHCAAPAGPAAAGRGPGTPDTGTGRGPRGVGLDGEASRYRLDGRPRGPRRAQLPAADHAVRPGGRACAQAGEPADAVLRTRGSGSRPPCAVAYGPDLAAIAADCGYYDQSHLDRDFAQYVGLSPTAGSPRSAEIYKPAADADRRRLEP